MLYFRREKDNGEIEFLPFILGCAYIHCKDCGRMVPVYDLSELLSETASGDDVAFEIDQCDECLEAYCEQEDKYTQKH